MSPPGPGETHRACISIRGPKNREQIKECMDEIREILRKCGGTLRQENLRDPLSMLRRKRVSRRKKASPRRHD